MKNLKVFILLGSVLLIPIALALMMHISIFSNSLGDANGWLGYWGGYLGALIGAATVYLLTKQQLLTQRELHTESLSKQAELHSSSLEEQRKLQMESIKISADLSDIRQRELIIANLKISKIESLVQSLIMLYGLNTERFNLLRKYNDVNIEVKKILRKHKIAVRNRYFKKIFDKEKVEMSHSFHRVSSSLIKKKRVTLNIKESKEKVRQRNMELKTILENETLKRNEIIDVSAKIKSEGLIVNLDKDLDSFRAFQNTVLNAFFDPINENKMSYSDFKNLIDMYEVKFKKDLNIELKRCNKQLTKAINGFTNPKNIEKLI